MGALCLKQRMPCGGCLRRVCVQPASGSQSGVMQQWCDVNHPSPCPSNPMQARPSTTPSGTHWCGNSRRWAPGLRRLCHGGPCTAADAAIGDAFTQCTPGEAPSTQLPQCLHVAGRGGAQHAHAHARATSTELPSICQFPETLVSTPAPRTLHSSLVKRSTH